MPEAAESYVATAERLCDTLDRIGDALVAIDSATLLQTEDTLSRLLAALTSQSVTDNRTTVEPLVRRARAGLLRCRTLGASFNGVARVRLPLCTGGDGYGRDGDYTTGNTSGMLKATV
jgi:hypothetical protein